MNNHDRKLVLYDYTEDIVTFFIEQCSLYANRAIILCYYWNKTTWVGTTSQSFSLGVTVNLQHDGIEIRKQCSDFNCVKSVYIQGGSGMYYATFWINMGTNSEYSVQMQDKICTRKKLQTFCFAVHKLKSVFVPALWDKFISLV